MGAFLAGVSLAALPSAMHSDRVWWDFETFFSCSSSLTWALPHAQRAWTAVTCRLMLSLFVLIGNPLIVMVILGAMGYRKRTGLLAGLTVAQISEFSLMLGALGKSLGHIGGEVLALITLVGLITITLSTYLITYSHLLYERLTPGLSWFERKIPFREAAMETMADSSRSFDVIVFGLGRFGNHITREFSEHGRQVLGVDFDPDVVRRLGDCDCTIVYGDAEDPEFAATLPLSRADWVVSSVPQLSVNLTLLQSLRGMALWVVLPRGAQRSQCRGAKKCGQRRRILTLSRCRQRSRRSSVCVFQCRAGVEDSQASQF